MFFKTGGRDSSTEASSNIEEFSLRGGVKKERKDQCHFWVTQQQCMENTKR